MRDEKPWLINHEKFIIEDHKGVLNCCPFGAIIHGMTICRGFLYGSDTFHSLVSPDACKEELTLWKQYVPMHWES